MSLRTFSVACVFWLLLLASSSSVVAAKVLSSTAAAAADDAGNSTTTDITAPFGPLRLSSSSQLLPSTTQQRDLRTECFETNIELRLAVEDYLTSSIKRRSNAARKYGFPMGNWCVSRLRDFSYAFFGAKFDGRSERENLGKWNVRRATSLECMFMNSDYDGDLANWDTVRVTFYP